MTLTPEMEMVAHQHAQQKTDTIAIHLKLLKYPHV